MIARGMTATPEVGGLSWYVRVAGPDGSNWITVEQAHALHVDLGAALDLATAQLAHEHGLPLAERVWLFLARMDGPVEVDVVASRLAVTEAAVEAALVELFNSARVERFRPTWSAPHARALLYSARGDRSIARLPRVAPAARCLARGALIVAEASAGARLVDAREALARIPGHRVADHERARVRLEQAEQARSATRAALEAGGGR